MAGPRTPSPKLNIGWPLLGRRIASKMAKFADEPEFIITKCLTPRYSAILDSNSATFLPMIKNPD